MRAALITAMTLALSACASRIRRVHYVPAEGRSASGSTGCTTRPC